MLIVDSYELKKKNNNTLTFNKMHMIVAIKKKKLTFNLIHLASLSHIVCFYFGQILYIPLTDGRSTPQGKLRHQYP